MSPFFLSLLILSQLPLVSFGKAYIPTNDNEVIEKLNTSFGFSSTKKIKDLKSKLAENPKNIDLAIDFSKQCIEAFRNTSDPRYLGYAKSSLKPWSNKEQATTDTLTLEAIILQSNHKFKEALDKLTEALQKDLYNEQAWLTKAAILQTLGEYRKSKSCCLQLAKSTNNTSTIICTTNVGSVAGSAKKSYKLLSSIIENGDDIPKNDRVWISTTLSETAFRLGDFTSAEDHAKQALSINPNNIYLLSLYSDILLSQNKNTEVIELLKEKTFSDLLLLKLAIAEKKNDNKNINKHINELKIKFAASKLRNKDLHLREEAIFNLKLLNKPKEAYKLAKRNWEIQKEPVDAQILVESSIEANKTKEIKDVINFIDENRLESIHIAGLLKKVEGHRKWAI